MIFRNIEDFLSAVEQTVWQNPDTRTNSANWKRQFLASYEDFYGVRLNIPRWDDIADTYKVHR